VDSATISIGGWNFGTAGNNAFDARGLPFGLRPVMSAADYCPGCLELICPVRGEAAMSEAMTALSRADPIEATQSRPDQPKANRLQTTQKPTVEAAVVL